MIKKLSSITTMLLLSVVWLSSNCYSKSDEMRVVLVNPTQGEKISSDEISFKIDVFINDEMANDSTATWFVAYYIDGKKVAFTTSIDEVVNVNSEDLKEGKHIVTVNVLVNEKRFAFTNANIDIVDNE